MTKPVFMQGQHSTVVFLADDGRTVSHIQQLDRNPSIQPHGIAGYLNGSLYWLYRAEDRGLWLMGESIQPIHITRDVVAPLEREGEKLRLKVFDSQTLHLNILYDPPAPDPFAIFDFTAASMDTERDNFGLFIVNRLSNTESRADAWTPEWYAR